LVVTACVVLLLHSSAGHQPPKSHGGRLHRIAITRGSTATATTLAGANVAAATATTLAGANVADADASTSANAHAGADAATTTTSATANTHAGAGAVARQLQLQSLRLALQPDLLCQPRRRHDQVRERLRHQLQHVLRRLH
jgi:hypothetical protein